MTKSSSGCELLQTSLTCRADQAEQDMYVYNTSRNIRWTAHIFSRWSLVVKLHVLVGRAISIAMSMT